MSFASVSSAVAALQRIALLRALEAFLAEPRRATSGAPAIWRDAMADMFVPGSVRIRCGGANSRDEARTLLCPVANRARVEKSRYRKKARSDFSANQKPARDRTGDPTQTVVFLSQLFEENPVRMELATSHRLIDSDESEESESETTSIRGLGAAPHRATTRRA